MEPDQLGPYRIVRKLGRGGMGTVFEGVNTETNEPAAIKALSSHLGEEEGLRQRFEAEIEALRKLRHPNIVRLLGFGEQDGVLYFAMELIEGRTLDQELRQGRRFDWREVARMAIDLCRALRHAHDRGIVHRDIKPANLLLANDGTVKLSDFGIARLFGYSNLTAAGNIIGTIDYMAPEQADAKPVGPRSDLYSLGCVLFSLLAGRPPFRGRSVTEVLEKHRTAAPEPVRQYAPDVPAEMEAIIQQLLEKDPDKRPTNALILSRRLESMLHALSIAYGESEATEDATMAMPKAASSDFNRLPATRVVEHRADLPVTIANTPIPQVGAVQPLSLIQDMPETRACDAVAGKALAKPDADSLEYSLTEQNSTTARGQFVVVPEEELDRAARSEAEETPLVSLHTWILVAALAAIGLIAWYTLRPPSADALYERIAETTHDQSLSSLRAAEDDIREFLNRYSGDPRAQTLRGYIEEIDLDQLESQFERQASGFSSSKERPLPVEIAYLEAIRYAKLDPDRQIAKLEALLNLYGDHVGTTDPIGRCLELARRRLKELQEQSETAAPDQIAMVEERLERADEIATSDPDEAHRIRRAVVELYEGKSWARRLVDRAQQDLAKSP